MPYPSTVTSCDTPNFSATDLLATENTLLANVTTKVNDARSAVCDTLVVVDQFMGFMGSFGPSNSIRNGSFASLPASRSFGSFDPSSPLFAICSVEEEEEEEYAGEGACSLLSAIGVGVNVCVD